MKPKVVASLLACSSLILALSSQSGEAATTVELIPGPSEDVTVIRGDGLDDRLQVIWRGDRKYTVVSGGKLSGDGCAPARPRHLRCVLGRYVALAEVYGGSGADRISLRGTPRAFGITGNGGPDVLHGSSSDEVLTGSQGNDQINGAGGDDVLGGESNNVRRPSNPGDDTLRGGRGNDELGDYYELGADSFFGGPGRDVVDATDSARDEQINGGPGVDLCRIDRKDPEPRSCEEIKIVKPTPYD